ncbi:helix-turn-helix domain-containing protein [Marivirga tractuosa]|uniref:helix-turn-helix domain-containing protein n=1 Tax=Marivirga tractuosa TaxID=1006 RepID=UPI0035CF4149
MLKIKSKSEYDKANEELERLIKKVGNDFNFNNPDFLKMDKLSDLIADYEDEHYPIRKPSLVEIIKLRMFELGLNQKQLAEKLEVPSSRISEYLKGKRDITLEVAKKLKTQLNIDADIILQ